MQDEKMGCVVTWGYALVLHHEQGPAFPLEVLRCMACTALPTTGCSHLTCPAEELSRTLHALKHISSWTESSASRVRHLDSL
jgi:hypothetical protein